MALKKDLAIPVTVDYFGIQNAEGFGLSKQSSVVVKDAYIKVLSVTADKSTIEIRVSVSKNANENAVHSFQYSCPTNLSGENFIKQAYDHLKTLQEFAGAVDC
jgi:hypothetical protein